MPYLRVWNLALYPLLTGFVISVVLTIEKQQKIIKILIFIKEGAYELTSLMSSHTDQVERRVDEPFQQFRQYRTSMRGQKRTKKGVN